MLAEGYGKAGQAAEGLGVLAEALGAAQKSGRRFYEAELYRLRGELTLQQRETRGWAREISASSPQALRAAEQEAEEYSLQALAIARRQQAKSWELRAVMSLSRLWQHQGKKTEAWQLLAEIYGWFTEGFDTKDLQEAKALLEELS